MGASNVKAVFELWPELPGAAFRALVHMALVSKDADDPPRYWGGREDLAEALGRKVPPRDDDDPEVTRQRNAAFKAARDATALLTKRGAISLVKGARTGQRQEWALNLRRPVEHGNRAPQENAEVHENRAPEVHENRADRCTEIVQEAHEKRAPKEEQETGGETRGVSQSVQEREAARWLRSEYDGLTDFVIAWVINHARTRAALAGRPIRHLVPYLKAMRDPHKGQDEADLADVIHAAMNAEDAQAHGAPEPERPELAHREAPPTAPPALRALDGDGTPSEATQSPLLYPVATPDEDRPRDLDLPHDLVLAALGSLTMSGRPYQATAARHFAQRGIPATAAQVDGYALQLAWETPKDRQTLTRHAEAAAALDDDHRMPLASNEHTNRVR